MLCVFVWALTAAAKGFPLFRQLPHPGFQLGRLRAAPIPAQKKRADFVSVRLILILREKCS